MDPHFLLKEVGLFISTLESLLSASPKASDMIVPQTQKYIDKSPKNMNQIEFDCMGIIVIAIIVLAGLAAFSMFRGEKKETIKVGVILPLTGEGERLGVEARDGFFLAVDKIKSRNGINGKKIELIIEDSRTDSKEGKKAFRLERLTLKGLSFQQAVHHHGFFCF